MELDPKLLEYFRQLNDALTEAVAIYQKQIQIVNKLAEKYEVEKDNTSDSSSSD